MSTDERDALRAPKKRRIHRACDTCRQRRRACDGSRTGNKKCKFCDDNGIECVYSPRGQSYTEELEARVAQMEKILSKLSVDPDRSEQPTAPGQSTESPMLERNPQVQAPAAEKLKHEASVEFATRTIRSINEPEPPRTEEEPDYPEVMTQLNHLRPSNIYDTWYLGQSSRGMLFHAAAELKAQYAVEERPKAINPSKPWTGQRTEYWNTAPWKYAVSERPRYVFPPEDVLTDLVDLYFSHSNIYIPLLHRPTFEREIAERQHLENDKFGAVVLLVCAVASRFSDDPRVVQGDAPLMCGWKYFLQLSLQLDSLFDTPVLYDLQRCCLAVQFLEGSAPKAIWPVIGIGIRIATNLGAHRRQVGPHTVEQELWRRAFWTVVFFDRVGSCLSGRSYGIQHEDYDIQMPTECDDDYWEDGFRQPPDVPSRVTFFNALLKLNNILAICLRFLYSLDKERHGSRAPHNASDEHLATELDSALNKWVDSIPEHLRWDPNRSDPLFFKQSVALYCSYYWVQTTVHRPFIPTVRQTRPTALPSLAICTTAARSCAHVAEAWTRRNSTPAIILLPALTTAGFVLLLNVWSGRRTGLPPHMNTSLAEVRKCMDAISRLEVRWQQAGMFWDTLNELTRVGDGSAPVRAFPSTPHPTRSAARTLPSGHKRMRSSESLGDEPIARRPDDAQSHVAAPRASSSSTWEDGRFTWLGDFSSGNASAATTASSLIRPSSHPATAPQGIVPDISPDYAYSTVVPPSETVDSYGVIDDNAMAMWLNAPTSLELEDWGTYLTLMSEINEQTKVDPFNL